MAGRFSDPLYSPGCDLIAFYNSMIANVITTENKDERERKIAIYEQMMKWLYEAYVPSYADSYNALGDQETFNLKYTFELTVYFSFYVFPFINDLFTTPQFQVIFLRRFGKLGPINRSIHKVLSEFYQWKRTQTKPPSKPIHWDFTKLAPLSRAESTFYQVGVSVEEARLVLDEQLTNLEELARFTFAWVSARVVGDQSLLHNKTYIDSIDLDNFIFDSERIRIDFTRCAEVSEVYNWSFDVECFNCFWSEHNFSQTTQPLQESEARL
jgi:hypothetical protein